MPGSEITEIKSGIARAGANWVAAQNPITRLGPDERRRLLGMPIHAADLARMAAAPPLPPKMDMLQAGLPAAVDWRSHNGRNAVTAVKNQGNCGSCVAFGTVATVESMMLLQGIANPDLSEAQLFFCNGNDCNNGWLPGPALDVLQATGVPDEACFPYPSPIAGGSTPACSQCGDHAARAVRISGHKTYSPAASAKDWLANNGPVVAGFVVYDDFFAYSSGVYRHVAGQVAGGHCVQVVGYSDVDRCWICKNSWGTNWGENGFFRIAYGECYIDAAGGPSWANTFHSVDGVVVFSHDILPGAPVGQGQWGSIRSGHALIPMHDGRVLDWVPADGTWRLWNYDANSQADFLPGAPVGQGQWGSIRSGHALIPMQDGRVLDWVPANGTWRLWNYAP